MEFLSKRKYFHCFNVLQVENKFHCKSADKTIYMQTFFKKHYFFIILIIFSIQQIASGQMILTGLYKNETIEKAYKQVRKKQHKSTSFIYYEPVTLPFEDDFSNYTGYPDTALWIGRQAFVNQSFAVNPPTIGYVTLDALDERGKVYEHASTSSFGADTLLSRPIRLDSLFYPQQKALGLSDSIKFCFFYQPGGGEGKPWEGLGNAPETTDSLILEFGYQTGNIALLYYRTDSIMMGDTIYIGDTIRSHCDHNIYIIAETNYYPGDMVDLPCDSVTTMEVIWQKVWASEGMTLKTFRETFNTYFRQIMILITDSIYFNKGFQFRFRNYASLEYNTYAGFGGNVDQWNIDYVRLKHKGDIKDIKDTAINDIAIVDNPGSMLKKYTSMPWNQFKDNKSAELKSHFELKLTNLSDSLKNTSYSYTVFDEGLNMIGNYSGGSENLEPFYRDGYQTYAPHAKPPYNSNIENTILFPNISSDSTELIIMHIFREAGSGDDNQNNDTARFLQKFYNYFAYDDGIPESGCMVTTPNAPYDAALAVQFTLNKPDTLQAIDIYINQTLNDASGFDFTLTVWNDNQGSPGDILYSQEISQSANSELYGFQRFQIDNPLVISGNFYVGYQTSGNSFLNVGFDQNNNNYPHTFWKSTGYNWDTCFLAGSPMIRPVLGKTLPVSIQEVNNVPLLEAKIYPNPAKDKLYIELSQNIEQENIISSIYSVTGQKIYENIYSSEIMLSNYPPGFYILRLTDTKQKQTSTYKFLISQ